MFVFKLCLALGMTVETLMSSMSARELDMWKAYYTIEPFGDYRADVRQGLATATLINSQSKRANLKAEDFVLDFKPKKTDAQTIKTSMDKFATIHNAKIAAKEKREVAIDGD